MTPDHHRRNVIISDKKNVTKETRGIHCMQLFLNINKKCELTRRKLNWKNLKELTCVKIHQFCREKRSMCFSGPRSSFPKESRKHFTRLRRGRKNAGDQITIGFGMERFWIEWRKPNQSNHNGPSAKKENTQNSQWELKVKEANRLKRGKTRATKSWLFSVLLPIGWESRANYLGPITEQSKAKPMQSRKKSRSSV